MLHTGEAQAIALALELKADRILLDDQRAIPAVEQLAAEQGLPMRARGTLAVIAIAAQFGDLTLNATIQRLADETRFRLTRDLMDRFLRLDPEIRRIIEQETEQIRTAQPRPPKE